MADTVTAHPNHYSGDRMCYQQEIGFINEYQHLKATRATSEQRRRSSNAK